MADALPYMILILERSRRTNDMYRGGPNACGGNNAFSMFLNPQLEGCYAPSVPGSAANLAYVAPADAGELASTVSSTTTSSSTSSSTTSTTTSSTSTTSSSATPTGPQTVQTAGQYAFIGCYSEATGGGRALNGVSNQNIASVEACAAWCVANGNTTYMGVEYYVQCYCGNTIGPGSVNQNSLALCNTACNGAPLEYCGGGGYLDMYEVASVNGSSSSSASSSTSAHDHNHDCDLNDKSCINHNSGHDFRHDFRYDVYDNTDHIDYIYHYHSYYRHHYLFNFNNNYCDSDF
ncbi:hypothetical protein MMC08_006629 [Hypocenomyce scalaris]|nr:hypothetical protein [Hypocenomyce scalaris]